MEYSEKNILYTVTRAVIELRSYEDYFSTPCAMSSNSKGEDERKLNMGDLPQRTLEALQKLDFEVQPTSFSDITAGGEMVRIREYRTLPDGDSGRILRYFPHFFVVHHSAVPERGTFFVTLAGNNMTLTKEAQDIYQRYFPKDLLIVGQSPEHNLIAMWMGYSNKPQPLDKVIHDRLET